MRHLVPFRVRVEKEVITRVTRVLPEKGVLTVREGQQVTPAEIIGMGEIPSGFRTINLSKLLSVLPQETEKFLTRGIGQRIYKDELLAYRKGWLLGGKKVVISPTDGVLESLSPRSGELKIAFFPKKVTLPAGVFGIVDKVDSERGQVVIRTEVTKIYGMCGSGKTRDGTLHILGKKDDLTAKESIGTKYSEHVLAGGSLFFKDAISAAISAGVNGIITGGINAADYKGMAGGRLTFPKKLDNDIGISLVVCEGFGSVPIGDDIFEILQKFEGKFVFIHGNGASISLPTPSSSALVKIKNTRLPLQYPVSEDASQKEEISEANVGMKVRIVGNSYLAVQGKLVAIDESLTLLPSGLRAFMATVETARKRVQVPVANLEIIG